MLRFLFPRLTAHPAQATELFDAITREARKPDWYLQGGIADSLDGRFSVLATLNALVLVRLEQSGDGDGAVAVALAERFASVMETEHRELGVGDPALGRKVRKLVSALGRRVELWRAAVERGAWEEATSESLGLDPGSDAAVVDANVLKRFWDRLQTRTAIDLAQGTL